MAQEDKRIFLTGGNGALGSVLVPFLLQHGYSLRVLVRSKERVPKKWSYWLEKSPEKLQLVNADLLKPNSYEKGLEGCSQLIHLLDYGYLRRKQDLQIMLRAQAHLFAEAIKYGADRIIWLRPYFSSTLTRDPYFQSVLDLEESLKNSGARFRILRLAPILGPGLPLMNHWVRRLAANRVLVMPPWGKRLRQFLNLYDLNSSIHEILARPDMWGFMADMANPEAITLQDLWQRILAYQKRKVLLVPWPSNWVPEERPELLDRLRLPNFTGLPPMVPHKRMQQVLSTWEPMHNVEAFFNEVNHFPSSWDKLLRDYFVRI